MVGHRERWERAGAEVVERGGVPIPRSFGGVADEVRAIRDRRAFLDASWWGRLRITGGDAQTFLSGQCTQDLRPIGPGSAAFSFVLESKGRCRGDLLLARGEDGYWGATAPGNAPALLEWLDRFVIAADVSLRAADDSGCFLLFGEPPEGLPAGALTAPHPLFSSGAHLLFSPAEQLAACLSALEADGRVPVGQAAFEVERLREGLPLFGVDLDENTLPSESGLFALSTALDKGCYTGQEVVAKQHYLGRSRRHRVTIRVSDGCPECGQRVRVGAHAGTITSAAADPLEGGAWAIVRLEGGPPTLEDEVVFEGDPLSASVRRF